MQYLNFIWHTTPSILWHCLWWLSLVEIQIDLPHLCIQAFIPCLLKIMFVFTKPFCFHSHIIVKPLCFITRLFKVKVKAAYCEELSKLFTRLERKLLNRIALILICMHCFLIRIYTFCLFYIYYLIWDYILHLSL